MSRCRRARGQPRRTIVAHAHGLAPSLRLAVVKEGSVITHRAAPRCTRGSGHVELRQPARQDIKMRLAGDYVSAARIPRRHVGACPVPTHRTRVRQTLPGRGAPALAVRSRRGMRHCAARRGAAGLPAGVDLPGQRAVPAVRPAFCHRAVGSGLAAHQRLLAAAHPGGADPRPGGGRGRTAPARAGHGGADLRGWSPLRRAALAGRAGYRPGPVRPPPARPRAVRPVRRERGIPARRGAGRPGVET